MGPPRRTANSCLGAGCSDLTRGRGDQLRSPAVTGWDRSRKARVTGDHCAPAAAAAAAVWVQAMGRRGVRGSPPRLGPAAAHHRQDSAAPTPGGPAAAAPKFMQSFLRLPVGNRGDDCPPRSRASVGEARAEREGVPTRKGKPLPKWADPLRTPEFSGALSSPWARGPAQPKGQARCPARGAASSQPPAPAPGSSQRPGPLVRPARLVRQWHPAALTHLKTSPPLQLAKVRPKSPGEPQVSS